MACVARCSLPQHAVNKNLCVRAEEIFLLQKSHAICVLQVAFIGSGDRYLMGAISQLRRAKWKPAPDVIGPRRYFHLAQPSAERDDSRRCFFVGAARPERSN